MIWITFINILIRLEGAINLIYLIKMYNFQASTLAQNLSSMTFINSLLVVTKPAGRLKKTITLGFPEFNGILVPFRKVFDSDDTNEEGERAAETKPERIYGGVPHEHLGSDKDNCPYKGTPHGLKTSGGVGHWKAERPGGTAIPPLVSSLACRTTKHNRGGGGTSSLLS